MLSLFIASDCTTKTYSKIMKKIITTYRSVILKKKKPVQFYVLNAIVKDTPIKSTVEQKVRKIVRPA